jgi:sugar/nucleoside kinase (ribokinase family)
LSTSLDCNFDPAEKWDSGIRDVLKHVDIFLPNETEALRLTGASSVKAAADELGKLARIVVVKRGSRGALVWKDGESFRMPALRARVVDATGAGDSFNAGFLANYLRGATLGECANAGVFAGSQSVEFVGGTAAFE